MAKSTKQASKPKNETGRINLSEAQTKALENKLRDWVESALAEKRPLEKQWQTCRSFYNNEPYPFVSTFLKNCADINYPFMQPKVDTLNDNVTMAVFAQDPICSVSQAGPRDISLALEKILQFFFEKGQLEEACRSGQEDVAMTNEGILRLVLKPAEMTFSFEPITPDDFIVLGSACYNLQTADMAGHAFYPTIQEVLDRVALGEYNQVGDGYKPQPMEMEATDKKTEKVSATSIDEGQRPTRIFFLSFLCDLGELTAVPGVNRKPERKWYTAHFDFDSTTLLLLREGTMKRHPYFNFSYLPRPTRGYWSSRSVASNLAGLHMAYQVANNMLLYGHLMTAFRPIVSKGPFAKSQTVGPGAMITAMGGEITIPNVDYDPKQLPWIITNLERQGDSSIRISQAGQAMSSGMRKTATQVMEEAQGQSVGRSGYVGVYTIAICELGMAILTYVEALWPEFKAAHGAALPDAPAGMPEGLFPFGDVSAVDLEITGASPASNPAFQFARGMMLLQMMKEVPELKRSEVLATILGGMQLRNATELVKTPEEMQAEADAAFQQQLMLAQAGAMAGPGAGAPPGAGGAPPGAQALPQGQGVETQGEDNLAQNEEMAAAFMEGVTGG